MQMPQTRRRFLTTVSLAGTVGILRVPPALAAEGALETTSVRFAKPGLCAAPIYVAKELLHTEGFTEIRYSMWHQTPKHWVRLGTARRISASTLRRRSSERSMPGNRSRSLAV
jgi:hypothetical protein